MDPNHPNNQGHPLPFHHVHIVHPMHAPPEIYGYPVDPSWGSHPMMHPHHMLPPQSYPYHLHRHPMEGVLPPGIPGLGSSSDPLEAILGPFPCARLRNLPYDATLEDILLLFQGLVIIDVVLVSSGEAYVVFANPMDYQMALQRDRQTIGRNFVEIFRASRADYYAAIALRHWQDHQRDPQQIALGVGMMGNTGEPQVVDTTAVWGKSGGGGGSSNNSLGGGGLGGSSLGGGPIQTSVGSKGDLVQHQHQHRSGGSSSTSSGGGAMMAGMNNARGGSVGARDSGSVGSQIKRTGGGIQVGEHTGFLRMRGLPFSSSKEDIFKFFEVYNPILESIVLTYRSDGRATGEAYVGFATPDDSRSAMELHRKSMGSRYIELFLSNKEEHGRAISRFGGR